MVAAVGLGPDGPIGGRRRALPQRNRRSRPEKPAGSSGRRRALPGAARARLQGSASRGGRASAAFRSSLTIASTVNANKPVFERLGCHRGGGRTGFLRRSRTRFRSCDTPRAIRSTPSWRTSTPDWLKDTIRFEIAQAERLTAADVGRAAARQAQMYLQVRAVLLTLRLLRAAGDAGRALRRERAAIRKKSPARRWRPTSTGCARAGTSRSWRTPAISVPAGFTAGGLPVGLQIVGPHRGDWSVLQLAHAFEQATGHGKRRPPVTA